MHSPKECLLQKVYRNTSVDYFILAIAVLMWKRANRPFT